jgi:hypothetical protein
MTTMATCLRYVLLPAPFGPERIWLHSTTCFSMINVQFKRKHQKVQHTHKFMNRLMYVSLGRNGRSCSSEMTVRRMLSDNDA